MNVLVILMPKILIAFDFFITFLSNLFRLNLLEVRIPMIPFRSVNWCCIISILFDLMIFIKKNFLHLNLIKLTVTYLRTSLLSWTSVKTEYYTKHHVFYVFRLNLLDLYSVKILLNKLVNQESLFMIK